MITTPRISVMDKLNVTIKIIVNNTFTYTVNNSFTSFDFLASLKEGAKFSITRLGNMTLECSSYSKTNNTLTIWLIGVVDRGHKFW